MSLRPTVAATDKAEQLEQAKEHAAALADYLAGALNALQRRDPSCRTDLARVALTEYRAWVQSVESADHINRAAVRAAREEMGSYAGGDAW